MTIERVRHRAPVRRTGTHSSWLAAQGLIGVVIGVAAVVFPDITVLALTIVLGLGLLALGVAGLFVRGRAPAGAGSRSTLFATVSLIAGALCLIRPVVGVLALLFGLVLWFFVVGVNDIVHAALDDRHRAWNVAIGVLSLAVALGLATHPDAAVQSLALIAGLGLLLRGALDMGLALALRRVRV